MEELRNDKELQIIQKETLTLKDKVSSLQIVDESSEKLGATYLSFLAKAVKNLEAARVRLTKPVLEAKRNIDNEFKAMMELPLLLSRELKDKLLGYSDLKAKKEEEKAEKVKEFAKSNGLPVPQAEAAAPQPTAVRTAVGTTFEKKSWTWEITDMALIPREFLTVDERKINSTLRDHTKTIKGVMTMDLQIAGIRFFQEKDISVRT